MRWRTFLLWNTFGGITWACTFTALGYAFGESIERVEQVVGVGGAIIFALIVIAGLVVTMRWLQRRQRARTDALIDRKFPGSRED
jgi:membrane protein DedA with SNARE-associated domain